MTNLNTELATPLITTSTHTHCVRRSEERPNYKDQSLRVNKIKKINPVCHKCPPSFGMSFTRAVHKLLRCRPL